MKTKVEFYKAFFEELEKKGFGVAQPSSPDYVVDIQFKGKTIAFYTKVDMIEKNPFVEVPEKQMERLWSMARATASLCGICSDQPYEEEKAEKLRNGVMKLNEHNGVILACKQHPLFGYVLSTYKQDAQNENKPIQRQYFYNREEAFESFATRSGLVDEETVYGNAVAAYPCGACEITDHGRGAYRGRYENSRGTGKQGRGDCAGTAPGGAEI